MIAFSLTMFGQVFKCKSYENSSKTTNYYGQWGNWSSWNTATILITIDFTNDRIKIFSQVEQVFDIITYEEPTWDADGDKTSKMWAVDQDAIRVSIRLVTLFSDGGRLQLYINYSNMILVYNMYVLD